MTVNVEVTSVNAADGSALYVNVSGTGGTLYPFTANVINVAAQSGLSTSAAAARKASIPDSPPR